MNNDEENNKYSFGKLNLKPKVKEDLIDIFNLLDGDKNKIVTIDEIGDLITLLKPTTKGEEIKQTKKEIGKDIDYNLFESLWKLKISDGENYEDLNDFDNLFNFIDTDHNGLIDGKDIMIGLDKIGLKITPDEADEMILEADLDGDRLLNLNEFSRMIKLL